jgi:hypothetical protein
MTSDDFEDGPDPVLLDQASKLYEEGIHTIPLMVELFKKADAITKVCIFSIILDGNSPSNSGYTCRFDKEYLKEYLVGVHSQVGRMMVDTYSGKGISKAEFERLKAWYPGGRAKASGPWVPPASGFCKRGCCEYTWVSRIGSVNWKLERTDHEV